MQRLRGHLSFEACATLRGRGRFGADQGQFKHTMSDISILGKMGRRGVLAIDGDNLIHGAPFGKLRIKLLTELARTTRTCIAALDYGCIHMFHFGWLPIKIKEESLRFTAD